VMGSNLDLVRSIFGAWERGDWSSVEWAHPDIEYVRADGPAPGSWAGLAGMEAGFRDWLAAWEGYSFEADEYRELDHDRIVVLGHQGGRGKISGLEVGHIGTKAAAFFHFRGVKVARLVIYQDPEHALADLGLAPEQDVNEAAS
jgi:ketosteroid isomerase-like protein